MIDPSGLAAKPLRHFVQCNIIVQRNIVCYGAVNSTPGEKHVTEHHPN